MMLAALCLLAVASLSSASPVKPWWGDPKKPQYTCGGTQGGEFHSYEGDYNVWGAIRRVEVWGGQIIDAVRFTHGDAPTGPKVGGPGGILQGSFTLEVGESINGVDVEYQDYSSEDVICRLTFITDRGRYGPYGDCRHDGFCGERTFTEPLRYVNTVYGQFIYWLAFTW